LRTKSLKAGNLEKAEVGMDETLNVSILNDVYGGG